MDLLGFLPLYQVIPISFCELSLQLEFLDKALYIARQLNVVDFAVEACAMHQ